MVRFFFLLEQVVPNTSLLSQGGATKRVQPANQQLEAQTAVPLSPSLEPGNPQQPDPKALPQLSSSVPQYTWPPQGGSPLIIPMQGYPTLMQQPLVRHGQRKHCEEKSHKTLFFFSLLFIMLKQ